MDYPPSAFRYTYLPQEAPARPGEHHPHQGAHARVTTLCPDSDNQLDFPLW